MTRLVSVIIPALNESSHIGACVASVFRQRLDGELEVIVVDGESTDDTAAIARRLGARVVVNPVRTIPAALNRGLEAARGDVVIRLDAHAEMDDDYVAACLRALAEEEGAVNVGGWCRTVPSGHWGRALGAAVASPFGVGNPRIWRRPAPSARRRDVETVPWGCYPAGALRAVNGWREDVLANEDFELNHRLRRRGGRVVFDPAIHAVYRPRETYAGIVRQYWRYGSWKAVVLADSWRSLKARQLGPVGLLCVAAAAPFSRRMRRLLLGYAGVVGAETVRARGGWRTAPVLVSMHLAWGVALVTHSARNLIRSAAKRRA